MYLQYSNYITSRLLWAALLAMLIAFTGCDNDDVPDTVRGKIVQSELLGNYTVSEVADYLNSFNPAASVMFPPQYGVEVYRLTYETISYDGVTTTQASGAFAFPVGVTGGLPLASYQHGTIDDDGGAPSNGGTELLIGVGLAANGGYACALPDYLGFMANKAFHPYHHSASEASAGIDMLRAARNFCKDRQIELSNKLFLFGYSQGGHSTVAMQREIEQRYSTEFTITASAPMSGAYDLEGAQVNRLLGGLDGEDYPAPYYLPYLLYSYNEVYKMYPLMDTLFNVPYNTTLPPFFEGEGTDISGIGNYLPDAPITILKQSLIDDFLANPQTHPLRVALHDNSLTDWKPLSPTRIYYCDGDQHVDPLNSVNAYNKMIANGADPEKLKLINSLAGGTHETCVLPSLLNAKLWFDSLK